MSGGWSSKENDYPKSRSKGILRFGVACGSMPFSNQMCEETVRDRTALVAGGG